MESHVVLRRCVVRSGVPLTLGDAVSGHSEVPGEILFVRSILRPHRADEAWLKIRRGLPFDHVLLQHSLRVAMRPWDDAVVLDPPLSLVAADEERVAFVVRDDHNVTAVSHFRKLSGPLRRPVSVL